MIVGVAILLAVPRPACSAGAPVILEAGDLRLGLESTRDGIRLVNLLDTRTNRNLFPEQPLPLFAITLHRAERRTR